MTEHASIGLVERTGEAFENVGYVLLLGLALVCVILASPFLLLAEWIMRWLHA